MYREAPIHVHLLYQESAGSVNCYHARIVEGVAKSQSPLQAHCFKGQSASPQTQPKPISPSNTLVWKPLERHPSRKHMPNVLTCSETVKTRFWPWLSGRRLLLSDRRFPSMDHDSTCKTSWYEFVGNLSGFLEGCSCLNSKHLKRPRLFSGLG